MRAEKRFILFISNEDMNDIIKIIKSLEDSNILIDGITETVKHEKKKKPKKQEGVFLPAFLAPLSTSIVKLVISSLVKGISGTAIRRAGRGYIDKNFLVPLRPLSNIEITRYFNYEFTIIFIIF